MNILTVNSASAKTKHENNQKATKKILKPA